jgi:hypothetical protein
VKLNDVFFFFFRNVNVHWYRSEDSSLKFQKPIYYATVMENDTKVRFLCAVTVIGAHLNEHLLFSILNPTRYFQIGSTTGILSTTGIAFDREVKEVYQIIVQVCNIQC